MDTRITAVIVAGLLLSLILSFVSIYIAGIAIVCTATLVMSLFIMQDTAVLPQVRVRLRDDAKAVIITNTGNSPALSIHVSLVPLDIEYDVETLAADASHEYPLGSMLVEAKAVVTFSDLKGREVSLTHRLSVSEEEYDPLKPMIPVFGWK